MKTCGGAAFSSHLPIERLFRDARAGWVMAPTVDHLEDLVGKALTGCLCYNPLHERLDDPGRRRRVRSEGGHDLGRDPRPLLGPGHRLDFVLFSNYERQVESLPRGRIDVAWNTPLAHARGPPPHEEQSVSLGMRDSDRDFRAKIVARRGSGIPTIQSLPRPHARGRQPRLDPGADPAAPVPAPGKGWTSRR
jgi:hypothetical protein